MSILLRALVIASALFMGAFPAHAKDEKPAPPKHRKLVDDGKLDTMKACSIYFHAKLVQASSRVEEPDREVMFVGYDGFQPKGSKWKVSSEEFDCFRNCVQAADEIEPLKKECAFLTH